MEKIKRFLLRVVEKTKHGERSTRTEVFAITKTSALKRARERFGPGVKVTIEKEMS